MSTPRSLPFLTMRATQNFTRRCEVAMDGDGAWRRRYIRFCWGDPVHRRFIGRALKRNPEGRWSDWLRESGRSVVNHNKTITILFSNFEIYVITRQQQSRCFVQNNSPQISLGSWILIELNFLWHSSHYQLACSGWLHHEEKLSRKAMASECFKPDKISHTWSDMLRFLCCRNLWRMGLNRVCFVRKLENNNWIRQKIIR